MQHTAYAGKPALEEMIPTKPKPAPMGVIRELITDILITSEAKPFRPHDQTVAARKLTRKLLTRVPNDDRHEVLIRPLIELIDALREVLRWINEESKWRQDRSYTADPRRPQETGSTPSGAA